ELGQPLPGVVGLAPLVLFLVELLQVEQGVLVLRIEAQHLVEGFERPIDEAAALVIEPQTEQHVRVYQRVQLRPLQQVLVDRDRLADLSFFAVQVAEDHVHLERVGVEAGGAAQLLDRQVDLVRDQEVQPEDVVRRLARAAPVDPLAVAQLVAFPGLADGEPGEQREERGEQRRIRAHAGGSPASCGAARYDASSESQSPCARRISSTSSRAAPAPPLHRLTKWTRLRTASTASAGAAARPARSSTGRSRTSSPM